MAPANNTPRSASDAGADYKLPEYTVYIDTSVAHSRKPSESISGKLHKWVKLARARTSVDVRVPEVVIAELTYQQFIIAQAARDNLKKNSQTLRDVCGAVLPEAPTDDELGNGARMVISKAVAELSLTRIATPVERIDWAAVVVDSCWRLPPFEKPQSADDLAEKGFRDKMVLETVKHDAETIASGVIAFVSGDNLLRAAFRKDVKGKCPIEDYPGFDELAGRLDLLAKTKSDQFATAVMARAGSVFYDPNDPACIALSRGVVAHLINEHSDEMSRPPLFSLGSPKYPLRPEPLGARSNWSAVAQPTTNWIQEYSRWAPVSPIKLFASPPVFQPTKQDGRYHWVSTVTLAQLLRKTESPRGLSYTLPEERIRTKDVDVQWSCQIDPTTAEFSDASVDAYRATLNDAFLTADWRSRTAYDLPLFPSTEAPTG